MKLYEKWMSMVDNTTKMVVIKFFSENPERKITTQDLSKVLDIPESTLSSNLNDLAEIHFLASEKDGKFKFYWTVDPQIAGELKTSLRLINEAYNKSLRKKAK